jgi:hypothetical protein
MADSQVKPVRDDENEVDLGERDVAEHSVNIKGKEIMFSGVKKPIHENSFAMNEGKKPENTVVVQEREPTQWENLSKKMCEDRFGRFQTCEQSVDSKKLNKIAGEFFDELEAGKQCHSNLYEVYKPKD